MRKQMLISTMAIMLLIFQFAGGQDSPDVFLSDIELQNLRWGVRDATFNATNNSDGLKFLAVLTTVSFSGSYLEPSRKATSFVILSPGETKEVKAAVDIPGNYGRAAIKFEVYDVVDTSDILLPQQKFFEQPFSINYRCPDAFASYFQEKIAMPPRVGDNPDFDNEFSRVLLYMLAEGKSVEEIAKLAEADTSFVRSIIDRFVARGYVNNVGESPKPVFPVITVAEAEAVKPIVLKTVESLSNLIKTNLGPYGQKLAALAAEGTITGDSNQFLDPGSVLYHRYPVIAGLLLWNDLGDKFIISREPLDIYKNTDPCDANVQYYMYAAQGGDTFNGRQFYHTFRSSRGYSIFFGDLIPALDCADFVGYSHAHRHRVQWGFVTESKPDDFMFDSAIVEDAVGVLAAGSDELLTEAESDLGKVATGFGRSSMTFGYRYWFWNQVATRVVDALVDDGLIAPSGTGQYRFIGAK